VWEDYRRGRLTTSVLKRERFRRLLAELGDGTRRARSLSERFLDRLAERGDLLPGCRRMLQQLARHFRLGVVSNGIDRVQRSRLAAARLDRFFEVVVTSEGCGFAKPDPRILWTALERLAIPPRRALYVGDDALTDGLAAQRAGVAFCWLDARAPRPASAPRPRFRVGRLDELPAVVGL